MQAIILCGGRGKRLGSMTLERPVSLQKILGKEILKYNIEYLQKNNVDKITLAVGYRAEQIKQYCNTFNCKGIELDISSCNSNGSSSAVLYAFDKRQENIIVYEGNSICNVPLENMIEFHISNNSIFTALVTDLKDSYNEIGVCINDEHQITNVTKESSFSDGDCDHCLSGVYIINKKIFEYSSFSENYDLNYDALKELCQNTNKVYGYKSNGYSQKIITISDFLKCQANLLDEVFDNEIKNYNGVVIKNNVCIGKNVTIESGAIIGPNTVVDDNCVIKSKCAISNSYIADNTVISNGCDITDSVVCRCSRLDSCVKLSDFTVIGDRSYVGRESMLMKKADIPTDSVIKSNSHIMDSLIQKNISYDFIDDDGVFTLSDNVLCNSLKFGMAVGSSINIDSSVMIGFSENKTAEIIATAVKYGILTTGADVISVGKTSYSQMAFLTNKMNCQIGIFVDSEIHSKIEIFSKNGLPIKRDFEFAIENAFFSNSFRQLDSDMWGDSYFSDAGHIMYKKYLCDLLPSYLKGYCVQIKTTSLMTAKIVDEIFHDRNDINGERLVFNINCYNNKCSLYSDNIGYLSWDKLVCICIFIMFEKGYPVAVPFTFPSSADWLAENKNGILYRYYNSSVGDCDIKGRQTAECEHELFLNDPLILIAYILDYLIAEKSSLKKILNEIPNIYLTERFLLVKSKSSDIRKALSKGNTTLSEGIVFENQNARAIIRNLKNEKGLIIFAESMKSEQAASLCDDIEEQIKRYESDILGL